MKKAAIILALTATLCAFASCDKEAVSSVSATVSTSVTTTAVSTQAENTTTEAVTATTAAKTDVEDTTISNADNTVDYSGMSGYWYANGDPKAAFFHITKEGEFTEYNSYYGAISYYTGYIKREFDNEANNYVYCIYNDTGELYKKFADDGRNEKTDIYFENEDISHYIKLYNEGGTGDDGRGAEETYTGSWTCGRATIEVSYKGEGIFHAKVTWSSSAVSHVLWDYPLIFDNGKLICNGNGTMTFVEFKEGETEATETVKYTDGSAEFTMEGNHLFWNDLNEHGADNMLFEKMNGEAP